jgi:transcriptional regulator of heat shock response
MPSKVKVTDEMWEQLRVEYISSDISLRGIAKKYGIPHGRVWTRAKNEEWQEQKEQCQTKIKQKTVDVIAEDKADECTRAFRVASKVMEKIEEYIDKVDLEDEYAMKNLKTITSAIKDLKEIGLFRSMLDQAEQEARIKKLQKDAEEEVVDKTITVTFMENDYAD